jgi:integrase
LNKAKDFWLFSYLGNGMNPKDILYLKNKDLENDFITFIRSKTERTTRNDPNPISIYITADMRTIIKTWRNKDVNPYSYIFPIMNNDLNPLKQYELGTAFTDFIKKGMAKIAHHLNIDKKITTIVSRHSFSTQLNRSGASTEFIQEALGHTDKRTTENYLDSFNKEVKKQYAEVLTLF